MVELLDLFCDASAAHEAILLVVLLEGRSLVAIVLRLVVGQMGLSNCSTLVHSVTVWLNFDAGRLLMLLVWTCADDICLRGHYRSD